MAINNLNLAPDEFVYISSDGLKKLNQIWSPSIPNKHLNWTVDYTVELPIRVRKQGSGSETPLTLIETFHNAVSKIPNSSALRVKRAGKWRTWNYQQFYDDSCNLAKGLIALGLTPYSSVNILGFNSPEWSISFYGSIFGNYLPVGIYTTNGPDACKYVTIHSDAEMVVVENKIQLAKYYSIWKELPKLKYIVIYNENVPEDLPAEFKDKVLTFGAVLELGKKFNSTSEENSLPFRMANQKPGNCCTLVYTSGTTGPPKGVMISHDNYTWTANYFVKKFDMNFGNEKIVSYLPLSHVASQIIDIVASVIGGAEITFADSKALQGTLVETLKETKPTFFFSVPRVWEKMEEKMKLIAAQNGALKKAIGDWAKKMGNTGTYAEINGKPVPFCFSVAKKLVYNNIKKALGLDEARTMAFGAAPMAVSTREYFLSLNFFLINAYGMSESSGPQTFSDPRNFDQYDHEMMASCGEKMAGTDMIIFEPDKEGNGEICYKGRNRFMGYYKNEGDTQNTIDALGFLHSGDVGKIDKRGNLSITGRIKELIITAGGENVAPVLIENELKEELPIISNAMVIGDKKKYLVVLLTLKYTVDAEGKPTTTPSEQSLKFLRENLGSTAKTFEEISKDEKVIAFIDEAVKRANEKSISRAQHIRKWALIPGDFTVEGGELTPTLKLKRKVTAAKYSDVVDKLYQDPKL